MIVAILVLFLNFNVKSLIFNFLTTNINSNNILLVITYFNLKVAYFSKKAFTIVYYILIEGKYNAELVGSLHYFQKQAWAWAHS